MKKLLALLIFAVALTISVDVSAQQFPFGDAGYTSSTTDSLTLSVTPTNLVEFVEIDSTTLDTILTINLASTASVRRGAQMYIIATSDDTDRDISFGTNITGTDETVTATK